MRAWTVYEATGRALADWQTEPPQPVSDAAFRPLVLMPPRALSHQRVEARLGEMVEEGALDEVEALLDSGYAPSAPVMKAVGVPEFSGYIRGEWSLADAMARAVVATRQLVKRQSTWLNGQFADWPKADAKDGLAALVTA